MKQLFRQGDVLIARVDELPEGLEQVPRDDGRIILAYGEATGHAHVVQGGECELLAADVESGLDPADVSDLNDRYLRVLAEATVVHDEHAPIALSPGDYVVRRQREYAPEEIRAVAD